MPALVQALIGSLFNFASSRIGQIIIAFCVAWIWSGWRADDHWRSVIAAEKAKQEAAYRAEVSRQEQAAREIAEAATARAEEDAAVADDLRRQIEAFDRQEKTRVEIKTVPGKASPCAIDDGFAGVVRSLDLSARKGKAPSRSR